tara:strand:+ start:595 stop:975 length:381 start_codon:yes stop_codon:yes gene_type:complete
MSRVRSKNTKPEKRVRSLVHSLGYRYRLHGQNLPGKPDLVFPGRKKVIFVHGCFWHRHSDECPLTRTPKSKRTFWETKFSENVERDARQQALLKEAGWEYLIVWECETGEKSRGTLTEKITAFLES